MHMTERRLRRHLNGASRRLSSHLVADALNTLGTFPQLRESLLAAYKSPLMSRLQAHAARRLGIPTNLEVERIASLMAAGAMLSAAVGEHKLQGGDLFELVQRRMNMPLANVLHLFDGLPRDFLPRALRAEIGMAEAVVATKNFMDAKDLASPTT